MFDDRQTKAQIANGGMRLHAQLVDALAEIERLRAVESWPARQRQECLETAERRVREYGVEPRHLYTRWVNDPPPYDGASYKWMRECVAAILDALNHEGIVAWDGDAVSIVAQIVQAYARRAHEQGGQQKP